MKQVGYIILMILCCTCPLFSQNRDVGVVLKQLHDAYWSDDNFDMETAKRAIADIADYDVKDASDSTKYYYHYWKASISNNQGLEDEELLHLMEAVTLREKSVGIIDPEYIELLWELGYLNENRDINKSIGYYQKALVIGQTILYHPKVPSYNTKYMFSTYGMVMGNLAEMYDKSGWSDRVPTLYETAFRFRSQFYDKDDANCYVDLYMLSEYYRKRKEHKKSVEVLQKTIDYITNNGGYGCDSYVNASYMLASAYSEDRQKEKALDLYKKTIQLTYDSLGTSNRNLNLLYGNYSIELLKANRFSELDNLLPVMKDYYSKDSLNKYIDILYFISKETNEKGLYEQAEKYSDSLALYQDYLDDIVAEIVYSQKAEIELNCNKPYSSLQWKLKALGKSATDHNNPVYAGNLSAVAFLYRLNSMTEESINSYLELKQLLEDNSCDTLPVYRQTVFSLYELYGTTQNQETAYKFLNECKLKSLKKYGSETSTYAEICNTLSVYEMRNEKLTEALKNNQIAESLFLKNDGKDSNTYATALHNKGRILMLMGKFKQALNALIESRDIQQKVNGEVYPNTTIYIEEVENKLKAK